MNKDISVRLYTDRGIRRIAISYKINNNMKGYNLPLSIWIEKLNQIR